jgi:AbrB family looped-hinge helix DNA binding protein
MQTRLSTKGQVVVPNPIRRKLGLKAGDPLDARIEGERIILTPRRARRRKAKIIIDPLSGLPVLSVDGDAPVLTSKQVAEMLSTFP